MARVLIVDDDPAMAAVIAKLSEQCGHSPLVFHSGAQALAALPSLSPQLVITDVRMDSIGGLEVLRVCRQSMPDAPVILVTADHDLQTGIEAMKAGAFDYIAKPFQLTEMRLVLERALRPHTQALESPHPRHAPPETYRFENLVGLSRKMQDLFALVAKVAQTDSTILIEGESGTGKELVARALHFNSHRQNKPFVALNCSALPDNLLESELFGHKRGAFTGAVADKPGLFEEAEGGTLFLDEVTSMSPLMQSKLLRVLQERQIRRVGDTKTLSIHVRVLAAANEPLFEKTQTGAFREDLYYRLAVIPMSLPPLRERLEDIPLLVNHFLQKQAQSRPRSQVFRLHETALEKLFQYSWPGNVRELENAIERASALCDNGLIQEHDLPPQISRISGRLENPLLRPIELGLPLDHFLITQEALYIEATIRMHNGDRERAARTLKISMATLYRKLEAAKKFGHLQTPLPRAPRKKQRAPRRPPSATPTPDGPLPSA